MAWPNSYNRSVSRFRSSASAALLLAVQCGLAHNDRRDQKPGYRDVRLRIFRLEASDRGLEIVEKTQGRHHRGDDRFQTVPTHGEKQDRQQQGVGYGGVSQSVKMKLDGRMAHTMATDAVTRTARSRPDFSRGILSGYRRILGRSLGVQRLGFKPSGA